MWNPAEWNKTVEAVLAHHEAVHTALSRAAFGLYTKANWAMRAHRDTGNAFVGLEHRALDWVVYLEDPATTNEKGEKSDAQASALSIEFGHLTKGGNRVGGLHILTGAANSMARTSKKRWDK